MGRRLQQALRAKGFTSVRDPSHADLIIAHSGGALLLPKKVRATQIIQIGPYWPGESWAAATRRKLADDMRSHHEEGELQFWLRKSFWNFVYLWKVPTALRMFQGFKRGWHWRYGDITTVVRPRFDSYCSQNYKTRFTREPIFLSFNGHHDDVWRSPEPYLALVKTAK